MQFWILTADVLPLKAFCDSMKITKGGQQSRQESSWISSTDVELAVRKRDFHLLLQEPKLYHDYSEDSSLNCVCVFLTQSIDPKHQYNNYPLW